MITCTCGHTVSDFDDAIACNVKTEALDYERGYVPAIGTVSLCKACYAANDAKGIVLKTEKQEQDYLAGKLPNGLVY